MLLPLSWIKERIAIDKTPQEIAHILTQLGLEVDSIELEPMPFEGVVVGLVKTAEKHPNADKLQIANVFDGKDEYQVVCAAPNCRAGLVTAFARPGAKVVDDKGQNFVIKATKIRGIESSGMLCALDELFLADRADGIIELDANTTLGKDVKELFQDVIFEISLTPNLGHASSLMGVVRELSAALATSFSYPPVVVQEAQGESLIQEIKLILEAKDLTPKYTARLIKGVKVAPSPIWIQRKLKACGVNPINNIVDITNLVLLELGQPLHAFDRSKVEGSEIIVREAKDGELFTSLDGKERTLEKGVLVIADSKKAIAIAGIIGGANSAVSDETKDVLLESACFDPRSIRKSSKKLGIMTDASKHFERGIDFERVLYALDRAAMLIQEVAGGEIIKGFIEEKSTREPVTISCRLNRIEELLGFPVPAQEVEALLKRLECHISWDGKNLFKVIVPSYRNDLKAEIDLIEEIARLFGYDNIPKRPARLTISTLPSAPIFLIENEVRRRLLSSGLQEFLCCDLISPESVSLLRDPKVNERLAVVINPTSQDQSILRPSLIPGLLQTVKHNWNFQVKEIAGFEVGKIHFKTDKSYKEQSMAGVVLSGHSTPSDWSDTNRLVDFFDLKGVFENLLGEMRIEEIEFRPSSWGLFHDGRQASIFARGHEIGVIGEVHPAVLRQLDMPQRIMVGEVSLHDLAQARSTPPKMVPMPSFPCSERDWTITLKEEAPMSDVLQVVKRVPSSYLEEVSLVGIYRSEKLGSRKNVTLHFVYRDRQKTIQQETVDLEHARVTEEALVKLAAFK